MNADEIKADAEGSNTNELPVAGGYQPKPEEVSEWGWLSGEPCRYCRHIGKIYFMRDDGRERNLSQNIVRCDNCGRSWDATSSSA